MNEDHASRSARAGRWARRNAANGVTLIALTPLLIVLRPGSAAYLPAILLFVDFIDSLDGLVARRLGTASPFGAQLDRTCDGLAHGCLVVAVAAQLPGLWILACLPPLAGIAIRLTRQAVGGDKRVGSSTNELLRHLFLSLLLVEAGFSMVPLIPAVMVLHTITMLWERPMAHLLRRHARHPWAVLLFYALLLAPLLWQPLVIPYAAAFFLTWLLSVILGLGQTHS